MGSEHMIEGGRSARATLDRLVQQIALGRGGIRITCCFQDGKIGSAIRVTYFRVPAGYVQGIVKPEIARELLEQVAAGLDLTEGECELTAEYGADERGVRLRWLDIVWAI